MPAGVAGTVLVWSIDHGGGILATCRLYVEGRFERHIDCAGKPHVLAGRRFSSPGPAGASGWPSRCRAARDGANIAIAAKTAEPNPKLPGTIFSAADEIEKAGGKALALHCDIRFEDQVLAAVKPWSRNSAASTSASTMPAPSR